LSAQQAELCFIGRATVFGMVFAAPARSTDGVF
jgi:hypothetical protein